MPETDRLDEVRLREFLAADYPRLVAAVRLVAGSPAAAEDAVAEALARAWERSDRGEPIANLPAWVMRAALNLATSRWRRLRAEGIPVLNPEARARTPGVVSRGYGGDGGLRVLDPAARPEQVQRGRAPHLGRAAQVAFVREQAGERGQARGDRPGRRRGPGVVALGCRLSFARLFR